MKKTSILLAALFAVCAALPAAAQAVNKPPLQRIQDAILPYATHAAKKYNHLDLNSIPQKVHRTVRQQRQQQQTTRAQNDTQTTCAVCGGPINTEYRHAPAENTNLCNECQNAAYRAAQPKENIPSICPHCGQMYTIDEKYHGVKHICPEGTVPTCAACGETITDPHQHCAATDYTGLCSASPETYAEEKTSVQECPKCHKQYTMEEEHHGGQHICPKNETKTTK